MSHNYNAELHYPIKYTNIPTGKFSVSKLPKHLSIQVNGPGWTILKQKIFSSSRLTFDISSELNKINRQSFTVLTKHLKSNISKQIGSELAIATITPDSLNFRFTDIKSKRVALRPDFKMEVRKQYILKSDIKLTPDSINISGPDFLIDKTDFIYTKKLSFEDLHANIEGETTIATPDNITHNTEEVKYIIPVEKLTEKHINIPVSSTNVPDSVNIKFFPSIIDMSYFVGISKFNKYSAYDFKIEVDYEKINFNSPKIELRISKHPADVNAAYIKLQPEEVEYLIENN